MSSTVGEIPKLSLQERDRRYSNLKECLNEKGLDCVVVSRANLFYLTNGIPGEMYGLFAKEEPMLTAFINRRHLHDVSAAEFVDAQEWVKDIRAGGSAQPLIGKIKELRLENNTIGVADLGFGGLSHGFYRQLESAFPSTKIVDVSSVFADLRTVKSDEEIAMIEMANTVFDAAINRIQEVAKPGMTGLEVLHEGIKAMWEAGGDIDSTFGFCFGPVPSQSPLHRHLCLKSQIKEGDIGTLTAHSEFGHYAGHSDQELSFGEAKPFHRDMFKAILYVRDRVLKQVKAGATHRDLIEAYESACEETPFKSSQHAQIHQYGIDVPEFPGPAFRVPDPKGEGAHKEGQGFGAGNFLLKRGMIYSISPTLVAEERGDTMLAGTTVAVTETGYRELGNRKVDLLYCGS